MSIKYYELDDGRIWDIENACFLDSPKASAMKKAERRANLDMPIVIGEPEEAEEGSVSPEEMFQETFDTPELVKLANANGPVDEECLRRNLKFFGKKLGELATPAERIEELIKENHDFLSTFLVLYIMGFEMPEEIMSHFSKLKNEIAQTGDLGIATLIQDLGEKKNG